MDIDVLRILTEIKYQKSIAGLSELLAKEAALRQEIQRLRRQAAEAQSLPVSTHSMQNIGADVIWCRWVEKATKALNLELARVLARKEALIANQRRALGRKTVADKVSSDIESKAKAARVTQSLRSTIEADVNRKLRRQ